MASLNTTNNYTPTTAAAATTILRRRLQTEWAREKAPKGIKSALEEANSNTADSPRARTGQIFRLIGLQAWLAYFLTTYSTGLHFKGRTAEVKTINDFDLLSEEERRSVATDIERVHAHSTVVALIASISTRAVKRRRK